MVTLAIALVSRKFLWIVGFRGHYGITTTYHFGTKMCIYLARFCHVKYSHGFCSLLLLSWYSHKLLPGAAHVRAAFHYSVMNEWYKVILSNSMYHCTYLSGLLRQLNSSKNSSRCILWYCTIYVQEPIYFWNQMQHWITHFQSENFIYQF